MCQRPHPAATLLGLAFQAALLTVAPAGCPGRPAPGVLEDGGLAPDRQGIPDSTPGADAGPCGNTGWACASDPKTKVSTCQMVGSTKGLPPGGWGWTCQLAFVNNVPTWLCHGEAKSSPAGMGWSCAAFPHWASPPLFRCTRARMGCDLPPQAGDWTCSKGSPVGGTRCQSKGAQECVPGQRKWCVGDTYDGWGSVLCKADGTWTTLFKNGVQVLDCKEYPDGRRPDTLCSCFHFFYNPACCERSDCVIPDGTSGRLCPKSTGKLCAHCNPQKPECVEVKSVCVVTNNHEDFCGQACDSASPCPTDFDCMEVKTLGGFTKQCVPLDYSCYY